MLKKVLKLKLKIFGIVILALVLVQLVSAYVFGFITENRMDLQFKDLTNTPLVKVIHRGYQYRASFK